MGMDPASIAFISSMGVDALSNLFGAHSQAGANAANLQYTQAHNQMLQGYVNQMMQQGNNPYSQALMSFLGRGMPSTGQVINSPGQIVGSSQNPTPTPTGMTPPSPGGGGQINANANMAAAASPTYNALNPPPGYFSRQQFFAQNPNAEMSDYTAFADNQLQNFGQQEYTGKTPDVPGYTGGFTPSFPSIGGVDVSKYIGGNNTLQSLINQGVLTQDQVYKQFQIDPNNPATDMTGVNAILNGGILNQFTPNNQQAYRSAVGALPYAPGPQTGPEAYLQGGQMFNNLPQAMQAFNFLAANPGQAIAPQMPGGTYTSDVQRQLAAGQGANGQFSPGGTPGFSPAGGGLGALGGFGGGAYTTPRNTTNMYNYDPITAAMVSPQTLGQAPLVGMQSFQAPQIGGIGQITPGSIQAPSVQASPIQAMQLGQINGVNVPTVGTNISVGTQGFNTGQDALMQALRAQPTPGLDPTAQYALQQQAGNTPQFQNSQTANALTGLANFNLNQNLDALHASAGDLGKRFGTGMMQAESQLRGNVQNNLNAQLAPLYQQSFEQAQQRQIGAAGQLSQNALGLGGLQASLFGTGLGGAQALAGLGFQGAQLAQQAQTTNAANQLQASQANAANMLQAGLATQGANVNIGLANQGAALQAAQGTAQQSLAASQANAANALQAGQFNVGQGFNAQAQNIANSLNLGQMNLGALMQAGLAGQGLQSQLALANQGMLGQYGMANANILNQGQQFNAGNMNQMAQFNANQGNMFNQFLTGALGQAGNFQNTQNQYNAGLLSLLAGLPIPQQQASPYPGAIGNMASTIAMMPFMNQVLQQPNYGGQAPSFTRAPSTYY